MRSAHAYWPALAVLALSLSWTGGLMAWPRAGEPVAALFPPAANGDAAFRGVLAAGADVVLNIGATPTLIVARSDDPRFVANLYASGALIVVRAPQRGECP